MDAAFRIWFEDGVTAVYARELVPQKQADKTIYQTRVKGIDVTWTFTGHRGGVLVDLALQGTGPLGVTRVDSLYFDLDTPQKTARFALFGNRWLHSETRFPCELKESMEYASDGIGLLDTLDGRGTVMAFTVPLVNVVAAGVVRQGGAFALFAKTEFTKAKGKEACLRAEQVFFSQSVTIDELFDIYRELLPQSHFPMPRLTGWNSWDYYLDKVRPEDIYENIEALSRLSFAHKLDYIVIDDGWQQDWGEWTENEKFACGLEEVAAHIKEKGFTPGIWMAPILTRETAACFEQQKAWLCRDKEGNFIRVGKKDFLIDPTVPDAHAFVLDNYRRLYQKGYRLFKIDFLSPLLDARELHDKAATPYSALRALIADIQRVTGEDAVILGCSLPIQCGADVAPSMRIGIDIHNHFSHVKWIAEALSWAWMYNGKVTRIDPDFLVVRGEETSSEPLQWVGGKPWRILPKRRSDMTESDHFESRWRNGDQFNAVEARTWARLAAITGGNLFLSDRISVLNERGIQIIEEAVCAARDSARPVYLRDDVRLPSVWMAEDELLVINWEDIPVTKTLKDLPGLDGELQVTLLPHESFLMEIDSGR